MDGLGNPKRTRSLVLAHKTMPVPITGIKPNAETVVRAHIRFILFSIWPEHDAVAIDKYLESVQPVPSPRLVKGKLSASGRRGRLLFATAGCGRCHSGEVFTDMQKHDVGLGTQRDVKRAFDTPTLREVWRTAPYLYDGRAATIMDVLTGCNVKDLHGKTSMLTKKQLADLAEYVGSL